MKNTILFLALLISTSLFSQGFEQDNNYGILLSDPVAADLNGDGLDDVVGIRFPFSGNNKLVIALQEAGSEISFAEITIPFSFEPTGKLDVGDIDGDGDMDIVVCESESLDIHIIRNGGNADFTKEQLTISDSRNMKILDIDNDGDMDIAGLDNNTETLNTYLNDGDENFTLDKVFDSSDDMEHIEVADMDNDGDIDIIIGFEEFTGDQISLFENTGGGNFTEKVIGVSNYKSLDDIAIGDLNGDGFMDVFGVSLLSNDALISNGDGTYTDVEMPEPGGSLISVEIADFTGEGRNDYIISNSDGIFWYRNTSQQPMLFVEFNAGTIAPNFAFAKSDLDNDGDIDLLISNGDMWWLENVIPQEPSATFTLDNTLINIYPNPVLDYITVDVESTDDLFIEIHDMQGKSLWSANLTTEPIDISSYQAGTYSITIRNKSTKSSYSSLIVKE